MIILKSKAIVYSSLENWELQCDNDDDLYNYSFRTLNISNILNISDDIISDLIESEIYLIHTLFEYLIGIKRFGSIEEILESLNNNNINIFLYVSLIDTEKIHDELIFEDNTNSKEFRYKNCYKVTYLYNYRYHYIQRYEHYSINANCIYEAIRIDPNDDIDNNVRKYNFGDFVKFIGLDGNYHTGYILDHITKCYNDNLITIRSRRRLPPGKEKKP